MSNPAWVVRSSEYFDVESQAIGDTMAVGVWSPPPHPMLPPDESPLQLVYVLDGSFALGLAAACCQLQAVDLVRPGFPRLLLVGLDYREDKLNARTRDYTPAGAVPESLMEMTRQYCPDGVPPEMLPGGAEQFLRFMTDELDPLIRGKYHVADGPAGILGDSYGGSFVNYAFIRQSPLFDRYWFGSPGIFTTDADLAGQFIETARGRLIHDTKMFLSMGALEMKGGVPFYEDMGRQFSRMTSALETNPNDQLTFRSKIYSDHTHTTVVLPAINDAICYLYGPHFPG